MKLLSLEVHNFCQHRHKEIEFHNRLNAFLGHNGSGKSNLLVSALGALTGDFSRTNGKKAENICQFADDDEPSYVKLKFEHGGTTATIQRGLRGKQSYFQIDNDDEKTRGDKAATAAVADLLGVSTQMINEYVFVAQGEIFAPLAAKPAERARSFQKLFGVSRAEKCWEALGEFLIQVRDQDRNLPDLDDVRARLSSAVTAVANWSEDVARYDDVAHWRESDDPDYIKLQAHQRGAEVTDRLEPLQVLIATCVEEKTRAESRIAELESQADRLSTACDAGHAEYGRAKGLLATHQLRVANRATRHRLESQLQAQLDEDQAFTPPEKPENYIPPEERETISDTINELKIEQRKCDHLLAYFAEPGSAHHKSECPTCGTHVDDIDVDADALRARLDGIQAEMDGLVNANTLSVDFDFDLSRSAIKLDMLERNIEQLRKAIAELPPDEQSTDNVEELRTFVDEYEGFKTAHQDTTRDLAREQTSCKDWAERLRAAQDQQNAMQKQLADSAYMVMSSADRDAAAAAVDDRRERYERRAELNGALESTKQMQELVELELQSAEERHREAANNNEFYEHLTNVRALLHRDNLPRIVSQNYLELLETDTNELLTLFDTDFQIRAIEGMGFEALFEDGRVQPAARLSGGQKVVLSLAFRIAVNAMFANDLSLLCLDEPTAYLDDDNLGCLSIALDRLRDLSASRGLQCVLITHEHSLGSLFDNVVQL